MTEWIEPLKEWFLNLGNQYGVNPIIFGAIYVGAIPFFTVSIGWLVSNYRKGKPIILPMISASFFFVSSYLYLIIAGENVPLWVYGVVLMMIVGGGYSTYKKVRGRIRDTEQIHD
jgi:ABC-type Co2+ transport system permease subunit